MVGSRDDATRGVTLRLLLQHWAGIDTEGARATLEGIKKVACLLFPFLLPRQDKSASFNPRQGRTICFVVSSGVRLAQVVLSAWYSLGQNTEKPDGDCVSYRR